MKALVTGATGFIGKRLTHELVVRGHQVSAAVRSVPEACRCGFDEEVTLYHFDLAAPPEGDVWCSLGSPEVVFHLAWEGLPNYLSPHHIEVNVPRHLRFLTALAGAGCPKVVVAGTCAEYGCQCGALREDGPVAPVTPYAIAKYALYLMAHTLFTPPGSILLWARIFYVTGARGRASLFDQLAKAVEQGEESFDLTGGEQLRDFVSVQEVSDRLIRIAEQGEESTVVNVGKGRPLSVRRVVEDLVREMKSDIILNWGALPYPENEPMAFWADVGRLNRLLFRE